MYSVKFGDFIVIFIKLVYYFSEQIKNISVSFFRYFNWFKCYTNCANTDIF